MSEIFSDTLLHWNNFYFMVGGAAATLIGLIFVAISLGANLVSPERQADIDTFVTPILFSFISVLLVACVMLVPAFSAVSLAGLLLAMGAFGLVGMGRIMGLMVQATQRAPVSWGHWWWHAILPLLGYGLVFSAALGMFRGVVSLGLLGLAIATALLLVCGIWRAWELVVWIVHQRSGN